METLPENIEPYPQISPKAYQHPADRAATAALKTVPMLDTVVRKLIEWQYERAVRQMFLSNAVRVGERGNGRLIEGGQYREDLVEVARRHVH